MSVMLEHQSVPQSPCTPDCPDRSGDCMLHCPHGYAEYRAARDKVYAVCEPQPPRRRGMPLPESGKPPRRRPGWPTDTKDDFAGSTR